MLLRHICVIRPQWIKLLRPSYPYTRPSLVQIMICRLFGAKPLFKLMLVYCQLDSEKHVSMKFYLKIKISHSRKKMHLKMSSAKWRSCCDGLSMLTPIFRMRHMNNLFIRHIAKQEPKGLYRWVSIRKTSLQCVSNGVTHFLHLLFDNMYMAMAWHCRKHLN